MHRIVECNWFYLFSWHVFFFIPCVFVVAVAVVVATSAAVSGVDSSFVLHHDLWFPASLSAVSMWLRLEKFLFRENGTECLHERKRIIAERNVYTHNFWGSKHVLCSIKTSNSQTDEGIKFWSCKRNSSNLLSRLDHLFGCYFIVLFPVFPLHYYVY